MGASVPSRDSLSLQLSSLGLWGLISSPSSQASLLGAWQDPLMEGHGSILIGLLGSHVLSSGQSLWPRRQGMP